MYIDAFSLFDPKFAGWKNIFVVVVTIFSWITVRKLSSTDGIEGFKHC